MNELKLLFEKISDCIDMEKDALLLNGMSELYSLDFDCDEDLFLEDCDDFEEDSELEEGDRAHRILGYYIIKLKTMFRMRQGGEAIGNDELKENLKEYFQYLKDCSNYIDVDRHVISLGLTILNANCPEYIGTLKGLLPIRYRLGIIRTGALQEEELMICFSLMGFFLNGDYFEEALSILRLIYHPDQRKKLGDNESYRTALIQILNEMVAKEAELSMALMTEAASVFDSGKDVFASDFLYLYSVCFLRCGEIDKGLETMNHAYRLRKAILGGDHVLTSCAYADYLSMRFYYKNDENALEALKILILELDNWQLDDPLDMELRDYAEGKTLYLILHHNKEQHKLVESESYIRFFERLCNEYDEYSQYPELKKRLSNNYLGIFYWESGNLLLAEQYFLRAIDSDIPSGTKEILSLSELKLNLATVYLSFNETSRANQWIHKLLDNYESQTDTSLTEADYYRLLKLLISSEQALFDEISDQDQKRVYGILQKLDRSPRLWEETKMWDNSQNELITMSASAVLFLIEHGISNTFDLSLYNRVLKGLEIFAQNDLNEYQKITYYSAMLELHYRQKHGDTLKYANIIENIVKKNEYTALINGSMLLKLCEVWSFLGYTDKAVCYLDQVFKSLTEAWHSAIIYASDSRLTNITFKIQMLFIEYYSLIRTLKKKEDCFECVLSYKSIASLVTRERNRHSGQFKDSKFYERICKMQNQLAENEIASAYGYSVNQNLEILCRELKQLESQYAQSYPVADFKELKLSRLVSSIPQECAIIEYVVANQLPSNLSNHDRKLVIDVYVFINSNGKVSMECINLENGASILRNAEEYTELLLQESDGELSGRNRREDLEQFLSMELIYPLRELIIDVPTIYLAPDSSLVNIPFELLYDRSYKIFGDIYNVIRIECARDFLFMDSICNGEGSLILASPDYLSSDLNKVGQLSEGKTEPLPFSEMEAIRVGLHTHSRPFVAMEATKKRLLNNGNPRILHISTHGMFGLPIGKDAIYSSCLLFAGYDKWAQKGIMDEEYGNGIVTADEISRLNLHGTELVVVSSCLSGLNDSLVQKNLNGMISAFAASGTKYLITHLWSADDFTSAVLMDLFYDFYCNKKMDPPNALNAAKKQLCSMTIDDLRARGWFEYASIVHKECITEVSEKFVWDLSHRPGRNQYFKAHPSLWAGFSCYRCN